MTSWQIVMWTLAACGLAIATSEMVCQWLESRLAAAARQGVRWPRARRVGSIARDMLVLAVGGGFFLFAWVATP